MKQLLDRAGRAPGGSGRDRGPGYGLLQIEDCCRLVVSDVAMLSVADSCSANAELATKSCVENE